MLHKYDKNQGIDSADKIPNLKEFIKYLNQTVDMFDRHVSDEEFERKDSDIHKLFVSLFNLYTDIDSKNTNRTNDSFFDKKIMEEMLGKNIQLDQIKSTNTNKKFPLKTHKSDLKWENNRSINSEKVVRDIYRKTLKDLQTSDDKPIIFSDKKQLTNTRNTDKLPPSNIFLAKKDNSKPNAKKIYVDHYSSSNYLTEEISPSSVPQYLPKKNHPKQINIDHVSTPNLHNKPVNNTTNQYMHTSNNNLESDEDTISKTYLYENTEDIDKKINKLKQLLKK